MSNDMHEQPKTTQLPPADPSAVLLIELKSLVKSGQEEIRADLDVLKHEGQRTNTRLTRIEERVDEVEGRIGRNSARVRDVSQQDMAQDAQLAQERTAREELAAKVDKLLSIGEKLEKVTKNPTAQVLAGMLATAAITWLAAHNAAPPPVPQLATPVLDGGAR